MDPINTFLVTHCMTTAFVMAIPMVVALRAKRVQCLRHPTGAWYVYLDLAGLVTLDGAFSVAGVTVSTSAKCLPNR